MGTNPITFNQFTHALQVSINFQLKTGLMLMCGEQGDFADNTIERTPDGKLHISGYVWSSLLRRALGRIQGGDSLAGQIGKYAAADRGVSPLWCESSFIEVADLDIIPGIRIDSHFGTTAVGALYHEQAVSPGLILPLRFNYFGTPDSIKQFEQFLPQAFAVIDTGIETIGSGWSYGYGRLKFIAADCKPLDLHHKDDREQLWQLADKSNNHKLKLAKSYDIQKPWAKYTVQFAVADGQLLGIHTQSPYLDNLNDYPELPDSFVWRRAKNVNSQSVSEVVIPGKAIRQALLLSLLRRKLRTQGETICDDTTKSQNCHCKICSWFGCTTQGGIIAVGDAPIDEGRTKILHRIQLCEHSMQNIQLFCGEYLSRGKFTSEILVDCGNADGEALVKELDAILQDIKDAPPGWYRLGATSTCTGQLAVISSSLERKGNSHAEQ